MPSRHRGRGGSLTQALDREVHQVVRKIIDDNEQSSGEAATTTWLNSAKIYDEIRRSNSSLKRKPKNLLEDSIERVLGTIQLDAAESESDTMNGDFEGIEQNPAPTQPPSNGLNRSIVGQWSAASSRGPSTPNAVNKDVDERQMSKRKANGEPLPKRRKATSTTIDRSPPTHVHLADLGGVDDVVAQFADLVIMPMTQPEVYISTGIQPPRGVLIHGPPGCGKTMIANAIAAELGVDFISISAPSIVSGMSGESEKALRDHFEEAKKCAPCLMFIDEIDAITPKRDGAQREMEKRIVAQLLTCMDDLSLEKNDGKPVIVLAATNRPDSLDPALRRGGRFDKEINMTVPSEPVRERILRVLTRGINLELGVDFSLLARRTPGFVGADLNDLVSTAGAMAIKRYQSSLSSQAEKDQTEMVDDDDDPNGVSPQIAAFARLVKYSKAHPMLKGDPDQPSSTDDHTAAPPPIRVTYSDFLSALPKIQPSSLREGFATVPSTTFADIGSLAFHISELESTIIRPILDPALYSGLGINPSSGILLWGPPGNGKTLLAKAVANSSHANFISVKGPELLNKYVGESERAVRQVFTRARSSVPVIIFFDELDALVPRRDGSGGAGSTSEAAARVVNTMLTELDGVGPGRDGIYVVAATNRPDIVDPAMLRPGRLETLLYVGLPDPAGRVDVLRTLCKRLRDFEFTDDIARVAWECERFSGADLEALLRRAVYAAIKRVPPGTSASEVRIELADFEVAKGEVHASVSIDEMRRYDRLQREWGKTAG